MLFHHSGRQGCPDCLDYPGRPDYRGRPDCLDYQDYPGHLDHPDCPGRRSDYLAAR